MPDYFNQLDSPPNLDPANNIYVNTLHIMGEDDAHDVMVIEEQYYPYLVPDSEANYVLGSSGAIGDVLHSIIIIPTTVAPGIIQIKDGAGAAVTVYPGGTVGADLTPMQIKIKSKSLLGAWQITTGANVNALCIARAT